MNDPYKLNESYFYIEGGTETPKVILDKRQNVFEFSGNSLPDDALMFYVPIIDWFELYKDSPNEKISVIFKLTYINSASSKMLHKVMVKLNELHLLGHKIEIQWHYQYGDEDMLIDGETILEELSIPYKFIDYDI